MGRRSWLSGCAAFAASVYLVTAGWGMSAAGAASTVRPTAKPLAYLDEAMADVHAEPCVHWVTVHRQDGLTLRITSDAGVSGGWQTVAYAKGNRHGATTIVLEGNMAYFEGSSFSLEQMFQMPSRVASELASRWISVPSTNTTFFPQLAGGLTMTSQFGSWRSGAPAKFLRSLVYETPVRSGHSVHEVVRGRPASGISVTFTLTAGAHPLPISERDGSKGNSTLTTYSEWGGKLPTRPAPLDPIPIASLFGSGASGSGTTTPSVAI